MDLSEYVEDGYLRASKLSKALGKSISAITTGPLSIFYEKGKGFRYKELIDYINLQQRVRDVRDQQRYFLEDNELRGPFSRYIVKKGLMKHQVSYYTSGVASRQDLPRKTVERWKEINESFNQFIQERGLEEAVSQWETEYEVEVRW